MSSNSFRISAELFDDARAAASALSRSTEQQVEHRARLGRQLERLNLTVADARELLEDNSHAEALWAYKRGRQAQDIRSMESGVV